MKQKGLGGTGLGDTKPVFSGVRILKVVLALTVAVCLSFPSVAGASTASAASAADIGVPKVSSATAAADAAAADAATAAFATDETTSITMSQAPQKKVPQDSVTVIGDSVPLGAVYWGDMKNRIANTLGISWCNVDCRASRQLPAGVELAKKLKAEGNLGSIVVYATSTNWYFDYEMAKAARDAVGSHRYVIFVTGYNRGYTYPDKSNRAMKELAQKDEKVFVADWNTFIKSKGGAGISDGRCHLTHQGAGWYVDVLIKSIRKVRTAKADIAKQTYNKSLAHLSSVSKIRLVEKTSTKAPIAIWNNASKAGRTYEWTSSNSDIVKVDSTGKLFAKKKGKATITFTELNPVQRSKKIVVEVVSQKKKATDISISTVQHRNWAYRIVVDAGQDKVTGVPVFKSNNPKIAAVNNAGMVIGKKPGTTKIKVSYGSISKFITVKIV